MTTGRINQITTISYKEKKKFTILSLIKKKEIIEYNLFSFLFFQIYSFLQFQFLRIILQRYSLSFFSKEIETESLFTLFSFSFSFIDPYLTSHHS